MGAMNSNLGKKEIQETVRGQVVHAGITNANVDRMAQQQQQLIAMQMRELEDRAAERIERQKERDFQMAIFMKSIQMQHSSG